MYLSPTNVDKVERSYHLCLNFNSILNEPITEKVAVTAMNFPDCTLQWILWKTSNGKVIT